MLRALVLLAVLAVAGCVTTAPDDAEPLPEGVWRGFLAEEGSLRSLPASLDVDGGVVEFVAGSTRIRSDQASYAGGRLSFRAPGFPTGRAGRRALRCNVLAVEGAPGEVRGFVGSCQAGTARYRLDVTPSARAR